MTTKIQPLLTWRTAIANSSLAPTSRHVALTLSLWMNEMGDSAFPGPAKLRDASGLSIRTVKEHLGSLVELGWLTITEKGGIKGEKRRANVYAATVPKTRATTAPVRQKTRAAKSPVQDTTTTRADERVPPVQEVHPNSAIELSKELSIPEKPSALEKPSGKTSAHLLTERHWRDTKPAPVLKGGFVALRNIVSKLEEAGYDDDAILKGLRETRSYTLDAIQFSLRPQAGKKSNHAKTLDNLRGMVTA